MATGSKASHPQSSLCCAGSLGRSLVQGSQGQRVVSHFSSSLLCSSCSPARPPGKGHPPQCHHTSHPGEGTTWNTPRRQTWSKSCQVSGKERWKRKQYVANGMEQTCCLSPPLCPKPNRVSNKQERFSSWLSKPERREREKAKSRPNLFFFL